MESAERILLGAANFYAGSTWCNGVPGMGIGRLASLPYLDDTEIRADMESAITSTAQLSFGMNHSLCHGDLGNLELLLQASLQLDRPDLHQQTYQLATAILDSIQNHGASCGVPLAVETPGLMTGLAGIGYQLLRIAMPEVVPSILTLEPPRTRS